MKSQKRFLNLHEALNLRSVGGFNVGQTGFDAGASLHQRQYQLLPPQGGLGGRFLGYGASTGYSTRHRLGLTGLTAAEYFRDQEGQDVLLYIDPVFGGNVGFGNRIPPVSDMRPSFPLFVNLFYFFLKKPNKFHVRNSMISCQIFNSFRNQN